MSRNPLEEYTAQDVWAAADKILRNAYHKRVVAAMGGDLLRVLCPQASAFLVEGTAPQHSATPDSSNIASGTQAAEQDS